MRKIFVDMDGVLTDFERRYHERFGLTPHEVRKSGDRGLYSKNWNAFVDNHEFETLDFCNGATELLTFLEKGMPKDVSILILTSSGGIDRHSEVQSQKLKWLCNRGIVYPAVVVPGRRYKAGFANPQSFMIDDTPDVIQSFVAEGGYGVINTQGSLWNTTYQLEQWLKGVHNA